MNLATLWIKLIIAFIIQKHKLATLCTQEQQQILKWYDNICCEKGFTSVSSTENLISCYEEILNATTSARNKSYENVLTICHAGMEAVPWQLVFLECFAIAVFD